MITILFRLLIDMVVGALIFVVIGLVALGLHLFTEWLEAKGMPTIFIMPLAGVEYFLFTVDVFGMVFLVCISFWRAAREIWRLRND